MEKKAIIGLKITIPPGLCDMPYEDFLNQCTITVSEKETDTDVLSFRDMVCKYYDDATGELYFHFTKEVKHQKALEIIFDETELIRAV